jgi:hypothetical protein
VVCCVIYLMLCCIDYVVLRCVALCRVVSCSRVERVQRIRCIGIMDVVRCLAPARTQ